MWYLIVSTHDLCTLTYFYKPSYCNFPESRNKIINFYFFYIFYPPTVNIICFVDKNKMFLRFFLCNFVGDTVQSDCPMQENYEIFKDLIQTVGLLY